MTQVLVPILNQMMYLMICIMIGFILKRKNLLPDNAHTVFSKTLNLVFVPALIINTFYQNCTLKNLADNVSSMLYCAIVIAFGTVIALILTPRFTQNRSEAGIYKYSLTIVNYGFMGNALIVGLFGEEMLFRFLMFCIPASIFVYSIGVAWLTAGKTKITWRTFLSPTFATMLIGIVMGLTQVPLPAAVKSALNGCANCFSPTAMILTGFVIGGYNLKKLIRIKEVYVLTVIRMILMPLLIYGVCRLCRVPHDDLILIMVFCGMPLGLNPIVFPAAYGEDTTLGASMAVISNVIGIITVPLILSLVL